MTKCIHNWAVLLFLGIVTEGIWAQQDVWIQKGSWAVGADLIPVIRLTADTAWADQNMVFRLAEDVGDALTVHNLDSLDHTWFIGSPGADDVAIPSGASVEIELPALAMGSYRLGLSDLSGYRLGGSSMLQVELPDISVDSTALYHWNLSDWSTAEMLSIAAGENPDPEAPYVPDQFTINERTYPATIEDPNALVQLGLGDTCLIAIANHGLMDHVLHFHGFHVQIVSSTHQPERVGWSKDTVPVLKGEAMTVQLVANQSGTYPVHDHNLIAVTNAGFYPGGMLTQIIVSP